MRRPDGVQASRDLVLIGGGHAHALVLKAWGMDPLPGARLTLISPEPTAPYTGMLPGHVAGHYSRDELDIDLVRLCRFAGARLVLARAEGLDLAERTVTVTGRPPVAYDVSSIDVGITGRDPRIEGLAEHGVPAKPLGSFADRWDRFVASGGGEVCVIGGGVAGVELALAMAFRMRNEGRAGGVTVVEAEDELLSSLGERGRRALRAEMDALGVEAVTGVRVAAVRADEVRLADGRTLPSSLTVGAAGATPHAWLGETDLRTRDGYVAVDERLRSLSHPEVFAAGDCAHLTHAPREKAGVYAVREAPILVRNLRAALGSGERERAYHPQAGYLKLVSTGRRAACFDRGGVSLHGGWVWQLKDGIDRRFMAGLSELPGLGAPPKRPRKHADGAVPDQVMCGGCGAKAGRAALRGALASLPVPSRPDVLVGAGDDAGVLACGKRRQVVTTDALRAFTDDPYLLAQVAAVHALGDVWAMGAEPQAAVLSVTLPRMTPALQARTLAEVTAAASGVLAEAGAALIGGHTALGAELSVGLTVTGLTDAPVGQDGARPGDAIVLTRPLGTGTVLAGEMRGLARGAEVARVWAQMRRGQVEAAAALAPIAHAMTDVTGFGLANHLLGICEASSVGAELDLAALPLLPGALRLAAAGVRSSLWADNVAAAAAGRAPAPADPRAALLYDPQTAGGLLACVPPGEVASVLRGVPGAVLIGRVTGGEASVGVAR